MFLTQIMTTSSDHCEFYGEENVREKEKCRAHRMNSRRSNGMKRQTTNESTSVRELNIYLLFNLLC